MKIMKKLVLLLFTLIINIVAIAQDSIPNQTKYEMTEITYTDHRNVYQDGRKLDKAEVRDLFFWTCQPAYDMYCGAQKKLTKGLANCIIGSTLVGITVPVYTSVYGNNSGELTKIQTTKVIAAVVIDVIGVGLFVWHIPQRIHGKAEARQSYDIYNEHAIKRKPSSYIDFGVGGGGFAMRYHF